MEETRYNKSHMFLAEITARYRLSSTSSEKNVQHIVLSLKESSITYRVGDSVAIAPANDPHHVAKTLCAMKCLGKEVVQDRPRVKSYPILDYMTTHLNLALVSKKLIEEVEKRQSHPEKKERLAFLLQDSQKEALKAYQQERQVWDFLEENSEVTFAPQESCDLLQPLLPRFYSVTSSMQAVGDEVHLMVAELIYTSNGHIRRGVATHYLCCLAPLHQRVVPIYIQPSKDFHLTEDDDAPIIMIGPGTGVAPYVGFMQERMLRKAKGHNWLIFGERHQEHEFYYQSYWQELVTLKQLRLDTAFSRDQKEKVYVQHILKEQGKEVFDLLEKGAYLYVCGDAQHMAKDVDAALHEIVRVHGGLDESSAKAYVKTLRTLKRYLRDVY